MTRKQMLGQMGLGRGGHGGSCWVAGGSLPKVAELGLNEEVAARQDLGEEHGAEDTAEGRC